MKQAMKGVPGVRSTTSTYNLTAPLRLCIEKGLEPRHAAVIAHKLRGYHPIMPARLNAPLQFKSTLEVPKIFHECRAYTSTNTVKMVEDSPDVSMACSVQDLVIRVQPRSELSLVLGLPTFRLGLRRTLHLRGGARDWMLHLHECTLLTTGIRVVVLHRIL
jgi:hypothetical protein